MEAASKPMHPRSQLSQHRTTRKRSVASPSSQDQSELECQSLMRIPTRSEARNSRKYQCRQLTRVIKIWLTRKSQPPIQAFQRPRHPRSTSSEGSQRRPLRFHRMANQQRRQLPCSLNSGRTFRASYRSAHQCSQLRSKPSNQSLKVLQTPLDWE